jgi:hypothetical protein
LQIVLRIHDVTKGRIVHGDRDGVSLTDRLAADRPACSIATGLRFCGMMLLDCTKPSPNRT